MMREQGMNKKKQIAGISVLLILIAITFSFYFKGYSFNELHDALAKADFSYLLASLAMMLLFILCEAVNIFLILKVLGYRCSFFHCFAYSAIGFYFSSITPSATGGQPAQIYYMKQDKISVAASSVTIFFITYVYQIAMILLAAGMFLLRSRTAVGYITKLNYLFVLGLLINGGAIFLLFSLMFSKKLLPSLARWAITAGRKLGFLRRADSLQEKLDQSLNSYHEKAILLKTHPELFFQVIFVTIIQMAAMSLIPALVYCGLEHETKNVLDILTGQAILTISVSAIPLPGAEGISQVGFLQIFEGYFPNSGLANVMLINRTLSFYLPLLFCLIMYLFTHIRTVRQSVRGDAHE